MKLELDFSDLEAPRLTQTQFRGENGGALFVNMDSTGMQVARNPEWPLKWTAGIQAVCLLLLRWKAGDPARLTGRDGASRTAFDFVRKCDDDKHPLARIFGGAKTAQSVFLHSGSADSVVTVELHPAAARKLTLLVRAFMAGGEAELKADQCRKLAASIERQLERRSEKLAGEEEDALAPLSARVDLLARRESIVNFLPVASGLLPLRAGDFVRLQARFSAPVHAIAVWLDSAGKTAPLHPWRDLTWKLPRTLPAATPELALPDDARKGWPLDTPPGIETVIVLARRDGLDANVLAGIEAALREPPVPRVKPADLDAGPLTYFRHGDATADGAPSRLRIGPAALPPAHPFEPFQRTLAARLDGLGLDCLSILSVPSLGAETSAPSVNGKRKK